MVDESSDDESVDEIQLEDLYGSDDEDIPDGELYLKLLKECTSNTMVMCKVLYIVSDDYRVRRFFTQECRARNIR
jgi:hypothetical protein